MSLKTKGNFLGGKSICVCVYVCVSLVAEKDA